MLREGIRALKCFVGGHTFCIDAGDVLALERGERMIANPAAEGPAGWVHRQRLRTPVWSLAELLGIGPRTAVAGVVAIVRGKEPWGMAVDRVVRLDAGTAAVQPLPVPALGPGTDRYRGVVMEAGNPILFLAGESLRGGIAGQAGAPAVSVAGQYASERQGGERSGAARKGSASGARLVLFAPPHVRMPEGGAADWRPQHILFGVSYSQTLEVVSGLRSIPVPGAPPHVLGLVPWRGRPLAVVDVGALLGFPAAPPQSEWRLVVVRSPRWRTVVGLPAVDRIQTRTLPLEHQPCPAGAFPNLSRAWGAFALGEERVLVMPDVDAIAAPARN